MPCYEIKKDVEMKLRPGAIIPKKDVTIELNDPNVDSKTTNYAFNKHGDYKTITYAGQENFGDENETPDPSLEITVNKKDLMDMEIYLGLTPSQDTELLNDILPDDVSNEDYSKFEEALKQAREPEGLKSTVTPADWVTDQQWKYKGRWYKTGQSIRDESGVLEYDEEGKEITIDAKRAELAGQEKYLPKMQCWDGTATTTENAGYPSGTSTHVITTALENKDGDNNGLQYLEENIKNGINLMIDHLQEGRPVQVGVNYIWWDDHSDKSDPPDGTPDPINHDKTTDHFILITAMKYDSEAGQYYFHFYEPFPAENAKDRAISENNRIYMTKNENGNYRLKGWQSSQSEYNQAKKYEITQIRPNGDKTNYNSVINHPQQMKDGDCGTIKCIE